MIPGTIWANALHAVFLNADEEDVSVLTPNAPEILGIFGAPRMKYPRVDARRVAAAEQHMPDDHRNGPKQIHAARYSGQFAAAILKI